MKILVEMSNTYKPNGIDPEYRQGDRGFLIQISPPDEIGKSICHVVLATGQLITVQQHDFTIVMKEF